MWWGEVHLALAVLTGVVAFLAGHPAHKTASVILFAWWSATNILHGMGGDQFAWTAILGGAFAVVTHFAATHERSAMLHWFSCVFFSLALMGLGWEGERVLMMTVRAGAWDMMCFAVIVGVWWNQRRHLA